MTNFDYEKSDFQHLFIRNDSSMLHQLFGTDDVVPFWVADTHFEVAKPITRELERLVSRGIYAYEFNESGVYEALTEWYRKRHDLDLDQNSFIQVPSVLTGISILIRELTSPGDGVLIQTPVYHQFSKVISTANRKIVKNPLKILDGQYQMDFEELEYKINSENVKLILLCNPHNPISRVWKKSDLEKLIAISEQQNITIVSDEIHSDIIFSGHKFTSITSLGTKHHIALLGSPSKTFGMQSISNGYIYIADKAVYKKIHRFVDSMYLGHGNALTTFATIAAFSKGSEWVDEFVAYVENNVFWIQDFVKSELPGIKVFPVEGTYQIWLDFTDVYKTESEIREVIVNKAKLGFTPGSWFDQDSSLFMRMNIASPLLKLQAAFDALQVAYKNESLI